MKKIIVVLVEILVAIFISILFFKATIYLIDNSKQEKNYTTLKVNESIASSKSLFDDKAFIECLENTSILEQMKCKDRDFVNVKNTIHELKETTPQKTSSDTFIDFIYYFIVVLLTIELFLMFETISRNLRISNNTIDIVSDFVIKVPPMLGIAGTLYSIAQFATKSNSIDSIVTLFKVNIASAIGTTLFAIVVYVINSLLFTYINVRRVNNEKDS